MSGASIFLGLLHSTIESHIARSTDCTTKKNSFIGHVRNIQTHQHHITKLHLHNMEINPLINKTTPHFIRYTRNNIARKVYKPTYQKKNSTSDPPNFLQKQATCVILPGSKLQLHVHTETSLFAHFLATMRKTLECKAEDVHILSTESKNSRLDIGSIVSQTSVNSSTCWPLWTCTVRSETPSSVGSPKVPAHQSQVSTLKARREFPHASSRYSSIIPIAQLPNFPSCSASSVLKLSICAKLAPLMFFSLKQTSS